LVHLVDSAVSLFCFLDIYNVAGSTQYSSRHYRLLLSCL